MAGMEEYLGEGHQNLAAHEEVIGVAQALDSLTSQAFGTVEVPFRGEKLRARESPPDASRRRWRIESLGSLASHGPTIAGASWMNSSSVR
jgi:hypothetical protein